VKIDIPSVLVHLRGKVVDRRREHRLDPEVASMKAAAFAFSTRGRYERAQRLARRGRALTRGPLPPPLSGWTTSREPPAIPTSPSGSGGVDAREAILGRVRAALRDVPGAERPEDVAVAGGYDRTLGLDAAAALEMFAERVAEYRATVHRLAADEVADAVGAACARHGAVRIVAAPGVPPEWRPAGIEVVADDDLSHDALDGLDGVLSGCAAGIALTGTIALDGAPRSGRRALTLLPDLHLCVVEAGQVVGTLAEALERLDPERPVTFISGPSATSDIELNRVEGVHGPRRLEVFVVAAAL
jgi:L-lactate dehydrogenase complex protein LldG